jgi:hypothetical protein
MSACKISLKITHYDKEGLISHFRNSNPHAKQEIVVFLRVFRKELYFGVKPGNLLWQGKKNRV